MFGRLVGGCLALILGVLMLSGILFWGLVLFNVHVSFMALFLIVLAFIMTINYIKAKDGGSMNG